MDNLINSYYLITIGTLIGYERAIVCENQISKKDKEKYRQIPFCSGICCVQTYRNLERATLEVKVPVYVQLLDKLGYLMDYSDDIYKEINYRLKNLNDAIEKYDLDSIFLIVEKLDSLIPEEINDIYYKYLRRIIFIVDRYYRNNEFPSKSDVSMLRKIFVGFPNYLRDILTDILFKYGMQNIIKNEEFQLFIEKLNLKYNKFIPNQINNLLYYCYLQNYENFYRDSSHIISLLCNKKIYIRLLDIYDLKITADLNANPTRVNDDLKLCEENTDSLFHKLGINHENIRKGEIPSMIKRKLAQHYYHLGYILMMSKDYYQASLQFEKSLLFDDVFEVLCKVSLFSCYDRMKYLPGKYSQYISLARNYDSNNKNYIVFQYYLFKYSEDNNRLRLKYLKQFVVNQIFKEDTVLVKILFYEINVLAKETTNYQFLQEFIEKMGIID